MSAQNTGVGPVLVVEHEASCPAGWLGEWLVEAGAQLDVRRPYLGDALPLDPSSHAGIVVLGGSMGAGDDADHPWLSDVRTLLRAAAVEGTPVLGVCLGLQLITVALGGEVQPNPRGQQIGVLPVGWLEAAGEDELFGRLTHLDAAVQWNEDVVRALPSDAVCLAETARAEIQAARFGPRVWGVQWHPEVGRDITSLWVEEERDAARERGRDLEEYVAAVAAAEQRLQGWRGLAVGFVEVTRNAAPATAPPTAPAAWHG